MYNILLSVCMLVDAPTWFSSTRSIDCKSKKDGVFSLVHATVWNAPNFGAKPPRQIWTILLSSMEAKESQMSLILEV